MCYSKVDMHHLWLLPAGILLLLLLLFFFHQPDPASKWRAFAVHGVLLISNASWHTKLHLLDKAAMLLLLLLLLLLLVLISLPVPARMWRAVPPACSVTICCRSTCCKGDSRIPGVGTVCYAAAVCCCRLLLLSLLKS
jgi:hypothetical protein